MGNNNPRRFPWQSFLAELIGTALLVLIGLSVVIFMFGSGSVMVRLLPSDGLRRLITGFLFGTTGALIAVSPVGKESGAHINPVVSFGFWLSGKLDLKTTLSYCLAQCLGAVLGCMPLLAWGPTGRSVSFGATLPGSGYTTQAVLAGEIITTFTMVSLLAIFLGIKRLRPFTPMIFPPLYAFMVYAEALVSGTSTNPARSLGPAVISGQWQGWWIYWVGPFLGAMMAVLFCRRLARRIPVAKLYYFDTAGRDTPVRHY